MLRPCLPASLLLLGLFCISSTAQEQPIEQTTRTFTRPTPLPNDNDNFDLFDRITVCYRDTSAAAAASPSFRTESMLGVTWWVMVYGGSVQGAVGSCDTLCPCNNNSNNNEQCAGWDTTTVTCSCTAGFGYTTDDDKNSTASCVAATAFGECSVGGGCASDDLQCVGGVCLLECSTTSSTTSTSSSRPCPHDGLHCVDDPRDACIPGSSSSSSSDFCPGLCVAPLPLPPLPLEGRVFVQEDTAPVTTLPYPFCDARSPTTSCGTEEICIQRPYDPCDDTVGCVGVCKPICSGAGDDDDDDDSPVCENDLVCLGLDPTACPANTTCTGYCDTVPEVCGGTYGIECYGDSVCTDNPATACDLSSDPDCTGLCAMQCGDPNAPSIDCPTGTACLADPTDICDPSFMVGCRGVCLAVESCGGGDDDGIACPLGTICGGGANSTTCVDDGVQRFCGTLPGAPTTCPDHQYCDMVTPDKCGPEGCLGVCADPPLCGGPLGDPSCPNGYMCYDDPFSECKMSSNAGCFGKCTKLCADNNDSSESSCPSDTACVQHSACIPTIANPCPSLCQAIGPCGGGDEQGGVTECPGDFFCLEGECRDPAEPIPCGGDLGGSNIACPTGFRCANDLASDCRYSFNPACRGICIPRCNSQNPCPSPGHFCNDDPFDGCDPVNLAQGCTGICQLEPDPVIPCGGPSRISCPVAFTCLDGACQRACGGFLRFLCPNGQSCLDDVRDNCDPRINDSCNGICVTTSFSSFQVASSSPSSASVTIMTMVLTLLLLCCCAMIL